MRTIIITCPKAVVRVNEALLVKSLARVEHRVSPQESFATAVTIVVVVVTWQVI